MVLIMRIYFNILFFIKNLFYLFYFILFFIFKEYYFNGNKNIILFGFFLLILRKINFNKK